MWWPYCEDPKHPKEGRFRDAWVIGTEEQHDESDDKDETLPDTFCKYHMTSAEYTANCEEDLEEFLKNFANEKEDDEQDVKSKIRKYTEKLKVRVRQGRRGTFKPRQVAAYK